jgi:hypothetical protein
MARGARCSALSVGRRMLTLTQRSPPVHFGARRVCWGDSPPRHSINFVGARQQHRRDFDAERFGSLAVNHQLEFRRLLYRSPSGFARRTVTGHVTDAVIDAVIAGILAKFQVASSRAVPFWPVSEDRLFIRRR